MRLSLHSLTGLALAALFTVAAMPCAQAAPAKKRDANDLEALEVARAHFQAGDELAQKGRWREAVIEYELSDVAHASPATALALAQAYEKLDRRDAAIAAYERYLASAGEARDVPEVRAHVAALKAAPPAATSAPTVAALPAPAPAPRARFIAPVAVAGLAVAALVTGGALYGTVHADVDNLQRSCAPACDPTLVDGLKAREQAGIALLAVGGAAAAVDIVLWALEGRRPRERKVALVPGPASLTLRGRF